MADQDTVSSINPEPHRHEVKFQATESQADEDFRNSVSEGVAEAQNAQTAAEAREWEAEVQANKAAEEKKQEASQPAGRGQVVNEIV